MFDSREDLYLDLDALLDLGLRKLAATPVEEIAPAPPGPEAGMPPGAAPAPGMPPGAPPVDPATGMPMDPAMMGGAPPVDPATGMPMDPAMMGGAPPMPPMPPEEDPLVTLLESMAKDVAQTKSLVATLVDQLGVKVPINDILEAGENPLDESLGGSTAEKKSVYSDGYAAPMPVGALVASHDDTPRIELDVQSYDANRTIQAVALWSKLRG